MTSSSSPGPSDFVNIEGLAARMVEAEAKRIARWQSRQRRQRIMQPFRWLRQRFAREVWAIRVSGCIWCPRSMGDLEELRRLHGYDLRFMEEAVLKDPLSRSTRTYGPYSKALARRIADFLNDPDVADSEGIRNAIPFRLERIIPNEIRVRDDLGFPAIRHSDHS